MMKRLYRITTLALVLLLCLPMFAVSAFAADFQNLTISAKVTITGSKPSSAEKYTIVFEPSDSSNPMPAGSEAGTYKLSITGAGKVDFPTIDFTRAGIYQYKIYQMPGKVENATYDRTVYTATVYVMNSEKDNDSLTVSVVANAGQPKEKAGEIVFTNHYGNTLPQTGIFWWPVPLLICIGLVFLVFGFIRRRRYEE